MEWNDDLKQGLAPMDSTHEEFVEDYNALAAAEPDQFLSCLDVFIAHTIAHFEQENRWMEKLNFPGCHRAEHDRVLAVLGQVRQAYAKGDLFLGKQLVEELPVWFESHVNGMDAALAFHIATIGFDTESGEVHNPDAQAGSGCGCGPKIEAAA